MNELTVMEEQWALRYLGRRRWGLIGLLLLLLFVSLGLLLVSVLLQDSHQCRLDNCTKEQAGGVRV